MSAIRRLARRRPRPLPVRRRARFRAATPAALLPAPVLTAHTDADPCPRVEVLFSHLPSDLDEITVYRTWAGGRAVVRGASRLPATGAALVVDYEVPLGISVSYSAIGYSNGVPTQESSGTSVTVASADTWLQDPLDPTSALPAGMSLPRDLMVSGGSFAPARYRRAGEVLPIHGSALPMSLAGTRQAAAAVPLLLDSDNPTLTASVYALLDQAEPLCVRPPADLVPQYTGLLYLTIPEYVPEPYDGWQRTLFRAEGDSVRPPGAAIVVAPRTYADLLDEADSYAGLLTLYPTYLDLLRGP